MGGDPRCAARFFRQEAHLDMGIECIAVCLPNKCYVYRRLTYLHICQCNLQEQVTQYICGPSLVMICQSVHELCLTKRTD